MCRSLDLRDVVNNFQSFSLLLKNIDKLSLSVEIVVFQCCLIHFIDYI